MAKKSKRQPHPTGEKPELPRVSELAALVRGIKDAPGGLPVLADFLEEKFGMGPTAALFRLPELGKLPKQEFQTRDFCFFPLTDDVFLWFTQGRLTVNPRKFETKPCTVVGLYAHPHGKPSSWCKVTRMLVGEDDPAGNPGRPWEPVSKPDPRIEAAKKELAGGAERKGGAS
jgi:hypothetical protein